MKKIFSMLVLAAVILAGTALFSNDKVEAGVRINRVFPSPSNSWISVKDGGIGNQYYIDLTRNFMRVEIESDSMINQRSAYLGGSGNAYNNGTGATVKNISNYTKNGKYYSVYEVKPTQILFEAKTNNGLTINYTLKFSTYNLATSKTEVDSIALHFAPN